MLFQTHLEVFTDDMINPFLEGYHVKTDEERIREVSPDFVLPITNKSMFW